MKNKFFNKCYNNYKRKLVLNRKEILYIVGYCGIVFNELELGIVVYV